MMGLSEDTPVRIAAGDRDPDLARRDAHLSADAEQLGTDGLALCPRPGCARKREPAKGTHQHIGGRREIQNLVDWLAAWPR